MQQPASKMLTPQNALHRALFIPSISYQSMNRDDLLGETLQMIYSTTSHKGKIIIILRRREIRIKKKKNKQNKKQKPDNKM